MARLPNVLDYGQRTSLRSSRVDPVHPDGVEIADAVSQAAVTFARLYSEKEQKDSRIDYALAKNEIMAHDIAQRQAIKERDDWEKFDEDYTTGFNTGRDEILARHLTLSPSDRALLESESNLMRERGRVTVGDFATSVEQEQGRATIARDLDLAVEAIQNASPLEQNELMLQALETVKAAEEKGWYDEDEAEVAMQKFVSTTATQSLSAMDAQTRLEELNKSMAKRTSDGAITREDIAAGKGSESVADFLKKHEVQQMIELTEKEIEIDETQRLGFEASDAAWEKFSDPAQIKERDRMIAELTKGNPEARKEALLLSSQRMSRMTTGETLTRAETSRELTQGLYESDGTAQMDAGRLATLTRPEQQSLRALQKQLAEGREWADATEWDAREKWKSMTDAERAAVDFDGTYEDENGNNIHWKTVVSADFAKTMLDERKESERRINAGGPGDYTGGLSQEQVLERALIATPYFDRKPTATSKEEDRRRWMRISDEFDSELARLDDLGIQITDTTRKEVLARVLTHEVFVRETGRDPMMHYAAVDPDDYPEAYIPLDQEVTLAGRKTTIYRPTIIPVKYGGDPDGMPMQPYTWAKNMIASFNTDVDGPDAVSDEEIEEVWFYLVTQGFEAARNRAARMGGM